MSVDLKDENKGAAEGAHAAAPGDGLDVWRHVLFSGKRINSYEDPSFIHSIFTKQIAPALLNKEKANIADFGCGNGRVARAVVSKLTRAYRAILPIGIDIYGKDLLEMQQKSPAILPVKGRLTHLPFAPDSFDAGIFRFALPFIPKALQPRAFQEICNVMKVGAPLVILNDGVIDTEKAAAYETLFIAAAAANGKKSVEQLRAERHFPSYENLKIMAQAAGFTERAVGDLTDIAVGYISPEIFTKLYKLTPEQSLGLTAVFKDMKEKDMLPFEPGSLKLRMPMYSCVFQKSKTMPSP